MWPFWVAHCWVWLKYSLIKDPKNSPESSRTFEICQKKDLYLLYVCMYVCVSLKKPARITSYVVN